MDASLLETLLPSDVKLRIDHVALEGNNIVVEADTRSGSAPCPRCRRRSSTLHSRYRRQLHDRPCRGRPLRPTLSAGKFICSNARCRQRIFCERLSGLAKPRARTSVDLAESHRSIGLALGGEAGARLAAVLSVPTSPDTILRRVKAVPAEPSPPPRFVGIDDWACRKGQSYGTILVDLERRTVIDLLPGRDGEALRKWLAANPQVEVVTRDRWPAYIEAISTTAPQAKQVADRFHLIRNVREAAEKMLTRYSVAIRDASTAVDAEADPTTPAETSSSHLAPPEKKRSDTERRREEKHRLREERFQRVKELTAQGLSCRVIARRLGVNVKVVLRYRRLEQCPAWGAGRTGPSQLDDHAEFLTEWIAKGHRNTADLFRVLKKSQGYRGGYDSVRRYLNRRIGSAGRPGRRDPDVAQPSRQAPSARKLSFRLVKLKPEKAEAVGAAAAMEKMKVEDGEQIQPVEVNLSKVTVAGAERLAGRPVFVDYDLFDNDDRRGDFIVYSNAGPASDSDDVERSLYAPDRLANLTGSGRGTIQVIRHPAAVGAEGTMFPGYTEIRVVLDP